MKTTGLKRNNNEAYYTQHAVAKACVEEVDKLYKLNTFDLTIEPSAGDGVFLKILNDYRIKQVISYDIDPKEESIIKADFLKQQFQQGNTLVIGNPPFGRQASLAKKFIKHCCQFARVIAFILPRSFKKTSMISSFASVFHQVFEKELDQNSFIYETKEYSVPCVFQIWERRDYNRELPGKIFENDQYKVVKKNELPNIAFRRVGVYAGKFVFDNFEALSAESHYFIKTNILITNELRNNLTSIEWQTDNTTGPKSISKQELIQKLNTLL
jgi:predicted RNA methylase